MTKKSGLKIVYVHDLPLLYQGKKIYGQYGFGDKYLEKFDKPDVDELKLITRFAKIPEVNLSSFSIIKNHKIKSIFNFKEISYSDYLKFNNFKVIIKSLKSADLIIVNMPSITGAFVFILSKVVPAKLNIMLDFASDGSGWETKKFGFIISRFMSFLMKYAINKSVGIIFVADYLKNKFRIKNKKFIVCSNVNIEIVSKARMTYKPLVNKDYINVITTSSISKRKGVDTIVKALNRVAADLGCMINLTIIGGEIDIRKDYLLRNAKNITIQFVGLIEKRDIYKLLHSSDVYIQASVSEGLPRATIEAMSAGLPVIATNLPCFLELKIKEELVFPIGSDIGLASSFVHLVSSSDLYNLASIRSIETANKYRSDILDKKRSKFINQIYSEIKR